MISIIIPVYNERESLPTLYKKLNSVLAEIESDYEILFIDDGSTDNSLQEIQAFCNRDSHCSYISFTRNFGKESAIYAGLCNNRGEFTAILDADLQDPPELLKQMYTIIQQGEYDCVAAYRTSR